MKGLFFLLVTGLLVFTAARAEATTSYQIVVPDLPQGSRLMGIKLVIRPAWVVRVVDCPVGWSVSVLNDPNWTATVEAHAIVGAAAITSRQASAMLVVSAPPDEDSSAGIGTISATGEITTLRNGDLSMSTLVRIALVPREAPGSARDPGTR